MYKLSIKILPLQKDNVIVIHQCIEMLRKLGERVSGSDGMMVSTEFATDTEETYVRYTM